MCKSNRLLYKLQIMSCNLQLLTDYNLLAIYPALFITQFYHNFTCNIIPVLLKAGSQKYIQKTSFLGMKEWMERISLHLKKRSRNSVSSAARYAFTNHKSLLLSHHHSTCALVSEILESVLQTVQKNYLHIDSTYLQTYTEYTYIYSVHTVYYKDILSYQYTLYTVCTHLYIVICEGATDYTLYNRLYNVFFLLMYLYCLEQETVRHSRYMI